MPTTHPINRDAATIRTENPWMTEAQINAYFAAQARWPKVSSPNQEVCGNAAMVECFYKADCSNGSMWIGIEPDGYAHS